MSMPGSHWWLPEVLRLILCVPASGAAMAPDYFRAAPRSLRSHKTRGPSHALLAACCQGHCRINKSAVSPPRVSTRPPAENSRVSNFACQLPATCQFLHRGGWWPCPCRARRPSSSSSTVRSVACQLPATDLVLRLGPINASHHSPLTHSLLISASSFAHPLCPPVSISVSSPVSVSVTSPSTV